MQATAKTSSVSLLKSKAAPRERERGGGGGRRDEIEKIPGVTGQRSSLYKYVLVVMLILRWWVFQDAVSS